jgi:hypothetical protein
MHDVTYVGDPGYHKIITAIRGKYFWYGMKKHVTNYLSKCMECQKVKNRHIHPIGFLHPFPILEWKWEVVTIDFITKLPRTTRKHDSIMVVVDKLIKVGHLIPVKVTHKVANIEKNYLREIARLHGVPKAIVSNRDPKFTSNFLRGVFKGFGKKLKFNKAYHPESDGKIEIIN